MSVLAFLRRRRTLLIALAVALALVVWMMVRRARGPEVGVAVAERRDVIEKIVASGRVLPPARVNLGSTVLGVVRAVEVEEGDTLEPGRLVVQLDDREAAALAAQARATVEQAMARVEQVRTTGSAVAKQSLRQADASLALARTALERTRKLRESGAATVEMLEQAERAYQVAESQSSSAAAQAASTAPTGSDSRVALAGLAQARAALAAAEARLSLTRITTPVAGIVLRRDVEPGDTVQPGRTLVVLARTGATRLGAEPEEKNLALLRAGQPALASADAFPDQTFPAVVSFVAPSVDPQRGTVDVKLRVPDPPGYLRPDMTVSINIEVGRKTNTLVIPVEALRDIAGREPHVLVVRGGMTVRAPVRLGLRGEERVEITAGLAGGEEVVVDGPPGLDAGRRVRARRR